jgi:hypothetical protein
MREAATKATCGSGHGHVYETARGLGHALGPLARQPAQPASMSGRTSGPISLA